MDELLSQLRTNHFCGYGGNGLAEFVGNLHIHTVDSDGEGTVDDIAAAAAGKGIDFIGVTDHSHMIESFHPEREGLRRGVLVLMGLEIGTRHNHYLAFGLREMIREEKDGAQGVIDGVNAQGGIGFIAHPFEKGMPFMEGSIAYTWEDLTVKDYTGICIWNFSSRFKERIRTVFHALFFLLFKTTTLKGPDQDTLAFWDRQCREKRVVAIGGSDAHGTRLDLGLFGVTPLPYEFVLGSINVHILVPTTEGESPTLSKKTVLAALREGRLYVAHDNLSCARGFRFWFSPDKGSDLVMGEEGFFSPGFLKIRAPFNSKIRVLKDGYIKTTLYGTDASIRIELEGVYRVELYRKTPIFGWRPWIFSNPIYLRKRQNEKGG